MHPVYVDKIVVEYIRQLSVLGVWISTEGQALFRETLCRGGSLRISIPLYGGGFCDIIPDDVDYVKHPVVTFDIAGHPMPEFAESIRLSVSRVVFQRLSRATMRVTI